MEAVAPVEEPELRQQLERLLDRYLHDDQGTWQMLSDGSFTQRKPVRSGEHVQTSLGKHWRQRLPAAKTPKTASRKP